MLFQACSLLGYVKSVESIDPFWFYLYITFILILLYSHFFPSLSFSSLLKFFFIIIKLRNKSWKPECVLSFNMGWRILVFYPEPEASMIYFDSDMSKSTNTVVYFDWKTVTVIYIYVCGQCRTQFMLPNSSRR